MLFRAPPQDSCVRACPQGGGFPSRCRCGSRNHQPGLGARQPGLGRGGRTRHRHLLRKFPTAPSVARPSAGHPLARTHAHTHVHTHKVLLWTQGSHWSTHPHTLAHPVCPCTHSHTRTQGGSALPLAIQAGPLRGQGTAPPLLPRTHDHRQATSQGPGSSRATTSP